MLIHTQTQFIEKFVQIFTLNRYRMMHVAMIHGNNVHKIID